MRGQFNVSERGSVGLGERKEGLSESALRCSHGAAGDAVSWSGLGAGEGESSGEDTEVGFAL